MVLCGLALCDIVKYEMVMECGFHKVVHVEIRKGQNPFPDGIMVDWNAGYGDDGCYKYIGDSWIGCTFLHSLGDERFCLYKTCLKDLRDVEQPPYVSSYLLILTSRGCGVIVDNCSSSSFVVCTMIFNYFLKRIWEDRKGGKARVMCHTMTTTFSDLKYSLVEKQELKR
jgi:hypothetical protein